MAKSSLKISTSLIVKVAVAFLAVLGLILLLSLTGIVIGGGDNAGNYSGANVMFGYTKVTEFLGNEIKTPILSFSFVALLPVIVAIAGVVCSLLKNKIAILVGGVLLIVAAIMVCFMPSYVVWAEDLKDVMEGLIENDIVTVSAGAGAWCGLVFFGLAGLGSLSQLVLKK